ncbi:MAG: 2Fe-2S iron-sulfur cluster-binding protein [Aggregatilineales bacterium]
MPKVTVQDGASFDVDAGTRLILALKDNNVDILHRCGGHARCTTCRVEFVDGEPDKITQAELDKLQGGDNLGKFRLSCQIECDADMTVKPLLTMASEGLDDPGGRPEDAMTPDPEWTEKPA